MSANEKRLMYICVLKGGSKDSMAPFNYLGLSQLGLFVG